MKCEDRSERALPDFLPSASRWLKETRVRKGLTQSRLAVVVGKTNQEICRYENFERRIPYPSIGKLVSLYNLDEIRSNLVYELRNCEHSFDELIKSITTLATTAGLTHEQRMRLETRLLDYIQRLVGHEISGDSRWNARVWVCHLDTTQHAVDFACKVLNNEPLISHDNVAERIQYPFADVMAFLASSQFLPQLRRPILDRLKARAAERLTGSLADLMDNNFCLYLIIGIGDPGDVDFVKKVLKGKYAASKSGREGAVDALVTRLKLFAEVLVGTVSGDHFVQNLRSSPEIADQSIKFEFTYHNRIPHLSFLGEGSVLVADAELAVLHSLLRIEGEPDKRSHLAVERWDLMSVESFKLNYIAERFGPAPFQTLANLDRFRNLLTIEPALFESLLTRFGRRNGLR